MIERGRVLVLCLIAIVGCVEASTTVSCAADSTATYGTETSVRQSIVDVFPDDGLAWPSTIAIGVPTQVVLKIPGWCDKGDRVVCPVPFSDTIIAWPEKPVPVDPSRIEGCTYPGNDQARVMHCMLSVNAKPFASGKVGKVLQGYSTIQPVGISDYGGESFGVRSASSWKSCKHNTKLRSTQGYCVYNVLIRVPIGEEYFGIGFETGAVGQQSLPLAGALVDNSVVLKIVDASVAGDEYMQIWTPTVLNLPSGPQKGGDFPGQIALPVQVAFFGPLTIAAAAFSDSNKICCPYQAGAFRGLVNLQSHDQLTTHGPQHSPCLNGQLKDPSLPQTAIDLGISTSAILPNVQGKVLAVCKYFVLFDVSLNTTTAAEIRGQTFFDVKLPIATSLLHLVPNPQKTTPKGTELVPDAQLQTLITDQPSIGTRFTVNPYFDASAKPGSLIFPLTATSKIPSVLCSVYTCDFTVAFEINAFYKADNAPLQNATNFFARFFFTPALSADARGQSIASFLPGYSPIGSGYVQFVVKVRFVFTGLDAKFLDAGLPIDWSEPHMIQFGGPFWTWHKPVNPTGTGPPSGTACWGLPTLPTDQSASLPPPQLGIIYAGVYHPTQFGGSSDVNAKPTVTSVFDAAASTVPTSIIVAFTVPLILGMPFGPSMTNPRTTQPILPPLPSFPVALPIVEVTNLQFPQLGAVLVSGSNLLKFSMPHFSTTGLYAGTLDLAQIGAAADPNFLAPGSTYSLQWTCPFYSGSGAGWLTSPGFPGYVQPNNITISPVYPPLMIRLCRMTSATQLTSTGTVSLVPRFGAVWIVCEVLSHQATANFTGGFVVTQLPGGAPVGGVAGRGVFEVVNGTKVSLPSGYQSQKFAAKLGDLTTEIEPTSTSLNLALETAITLTNQIGLMNVTTDAFPLLRIPFLTPASLRIIPTLLVISEADAARDAPMSVNVTGPVAIVEGLALPDWTIPIPLEVLPGSCNVSEPTATTECWLLINPIRFTCRILFPSITVFRSILQVNGSQFILRVNPPLWTSSGWIHLPEASLPRIWDLDAAVMNVVNATDATLPAQQALEATIPAGVLKQQEQEKKNQAHNAHHTPLPVHSSVFVGVVGILAAVGIVGVGILIRKWKKKFDGET